MRPIPDLSDADNAHRLAAKIRAYWEKQGLNPVIAVEPVQVTDRRDGKTRIVNTLRSNMVNGRPV